MTDPTPQANGLALPPTTVYISRHGETEWNLQGRFQGHHDSPLTPRGLQQAEQLAEELAAVPLGAVYSSDLGRARVTAEQVAARHHLQVRTTVGLREIDMGGWTTLDRDEVAQRWPAEREQFRVSPGTVRFPGGESFIDAQRRVLASIAELADLHAGKRVAVITHGTILETVLAHAMGLDLSALWLRIAHHCCAHVLAFQDGRLSLVQLGTQRSQDQPPSARPAR
jgi:broad specificity phosphatase PhoE